MSPSSCQGRGWLAGFPRVSGDEPADTIAKIARKTFSPRERG